MGAIGYIIFLSNILATQNVIHFKYKFIILICLLISTSLTINGSKTIKERKNYSGYNYI